MNSVNFAVGFTLLFCLSLFMGWDIDAVAYKQALLVFAGFCLGGVALIVMEEL
jgi:hypothetical protein